MPYPNSPFKDGFDTKILFSCGNECLCDEEVSKLDSTLKWLCTSPKISSYRVNTLLYDTEDVLEIIKNEVDRVSKTINLLTPKVYIHKNIPELIIVENFNTSNLDFTRHKNEVIVDQHCGAAVLRGSHIFSPGVMGMTSGAKLDDEVSVYIDLAKKCKKGFQKTYDDTYKVFIGNGIIKMPRYLLFGDNLNPSGIAIEMKYTIFGSPPLSNNFLPPGAALLQNIPSVICVNVLNPLPEDVVLDMCASPGNKTTHISAKMKNKGILVAIDKTATKVKTLEKNCKEFQANVSIFEADSTKICHDDLLENDFVTGPPFQRETFDKILLDAPCSVLGKRPQFYNNDSEKVIKSHVPLQRKLFEKAVHLLKVNGVLVYSTCTITLAENEGMVDWALKTFTCMKLVKAEPYFGGNGWKTGVLDDEKARMLQRFGTNDDVDSVGFFIAKFVKKNTLINS